MRIAKREPSEAAWETVRQARAEQAAAKILLRLGGHPDTLSLADLPDTEESP